MPSIVEKKLTLSGKVHSFACDLVRLEDGFGILKYVVDRNYRIHDIDLVPGDLTYAFYWTGRPYTLYTWNPGSRGIVLYFNIADNVVLSLQEFSWRDLAVDILVDANGTVTVLDEHELPKDLAPELRTFIDKAVQHILANHRTIAAEILPLARELHGLK